MLLPAPLAAGEPGPWHLLPEPKFMANPIVWPIPGSAGTVLLPARDVAGEVSPLTVAETADPALDRAELIAQARANASNLLARLEPEYVRDRHGAIRFAVISSENPLAASCVLAPDFAARFFETIGPDALVAIPNRFRIYIFPRSMIPARELSDQIFTDFRATNYPVSREVFETRDGSLRAVGSFQ